MGHPSREGPHQAPQPVWWVQDTWVQTCADNVLVIGRKNAKTTCATLLEFNTRSQASHRKCRSHACQKVMRTLILVPLLRIENFDSTVHQHGARMGPRHPAALGPVGASSACSKNPATLGSNSSRRPSTSPRRGCLSMS